MQRHEECGLAATAALLAAAVRGQVMDSEYELSSVLEADLAVASEAAKLLLAIVQWHSGSLEKALQTLDGCAVGAAARWCRWRVSPLHAHTFQ